MTINHSTEVEAARLNQALGLRALLVGGGISAQIAAQSLAGMGVEVTFARLRETPSHVYCAQSGPGIDDEHLESAPDLGGIETIDVDRAPVIRRAEGGFRAVFQEGTESYFDCLFLAPGLSLRPKPAALPEDTELFTSRFDVKAGERVVFVTDYLCPSDPALTMSAIDMATQNALNGGRSLVCFKHAAVAHLFGETLYDRAREAGVQFVRHGSELPLILAGSQGEGSGRFLLKVRDLIDEDEEFAFECDRVVSVTGPDASSIPRWALEPARGELDEQGFLLPESIHCSSGNSFASGVFVVGEATGNLDLINCIAQARAAAIKAQAWMRQSRLKRDSESISVSTQCAGCLTCHRVCPHEAISVNSGASHPRVEPWPSLCRDCGICASVCPRVAIHLAACPEDAMLSFVNEVPHQNIRRTSFVFGCRRSAGLLAPSIRIPDNMRFFDVPCAGRVSEYVIWSALAAGAKGVLVVGCHHGNCASNTGTEWAAARIRRGMATGLFRQGPPLLGYATVASNEGARLERLLSEFAAGHAPRDPETA